MLKSWQVGSKRREEEEERIDSGEREREDVPPSLSCRFSERADAPAQDTSLYRTHSRQPLPLSSRRHSCFEGDNESGESAGDDATAIMA